ncbi:hypothetical protein HYPSUDRAFT_39919 [Hypholoma sublateritium FD-334 SS-4]|uniref:Uncharacterized protein n=1 Tax=Hypholoma sublateritium (strain FD-334 SS-4) TaxID=945553 RepID=A0A0D2P434_HYPSF|nr:hypothetical protein HYPSUDRAFT_39919 [Hypholoma sublateritium FD-334 SS-4]
MVVVVLVRRKTLCWCSKRGAWPTYVSFAEELVLDVLVYISIYVYCGLSLRPQEHSWRSAQRTNALPINVSESTV